MTKLKGLLLFLGGVTAGLVTSKIKEESIIFNSPESIVSQIKSKIPLTKDQEIRMIEVLENPENFRFLKNYFLGKIHEEPPDFQMSPLQTYTDKIKTINYEVGEYFNTYCSMRFCLLGAKRRQENMIKYLKTTPAEKVVEDYLLIKSKNLDKHSFYYEVHKLADANNSEIEEIIIGLLKSLQK